MSEERFLISLERYLYGKLRVFARYSEYVIVILVTLAAITSLWVYRDNEPVIRIGGNPDNMKVREEVIRNLAEVGDYQLAEQLLNEVNVLGTSSEQEYVALEDLIYPERRIIREIAKIDDFLSSHPAAGEIIEVAVDLHERIGNWDEIERYKEVARYIDWR